VGAAGVKALGHRALRYGHEAARLGSVGIMAGAARLRAAVPVAGNYLQRLGASIFYAAAYSWAVIGTLGGIAADYLGPPLAPVGRILRQRGVRLAVLIAGGVCLLGGIIRAFANGFEQDTWIALLLGIGFLGALALAHASTGMPAWLSARLVPVFDRSRRAIETTTARPVVQMGFAALVLALLGASGLYAWSSSPSGSTATPRQARGEMRAMAASGAVLEGRGNAVSGDTLRVGGTMVRLSGIEAPLPEQTCVDGKGSRRPCGEAARQALVRLLRSGRVACDVSGGTDGPSTGTCHINDRDVAAELVRGGHVFAATGLFSAYGGLEREARAGKAGIWAGETARPAEFRDRKWEEAKRVAPDGCPIKGNVRGGRRYYTVPWARGYEQVKVTPSRGERWFCSESEAREAGFTPAEQS